jgi:hypothetical protein
LQGPILWLVCSISSIVGLIAPGFIAAAPAHAERTR